MGFRSSPPVPNFTIRLDSRESASYLIGMKWIMVAFLVLAEVPDPIVEIYPGRFDDVSSCSKAISEGIAEAQKRLRPTDDLSGILAVTWSCVREDQVPAGVLK